MRNVYKLLGEKYMNTISADRDPAMTEEDQALRAGAPGAGEQIESEGMERADESLYELTHDYLVSKNNETLMHYVNRAKNLDHLLHLAFEYTHEHMVDSNLTANDEVIEKLAKELHKFSHNTMPVDWLEGKLNKVVNTTKHEGAGMPKDPQEVSTDSTTEPEEKTDLVEKNKKKVVPSKTPNLDKNPLIAKLKDKKGSFGDLGKRLG